jgi:hypothetical protein
MCRLPASTRSLNAHATLLLLPSMASGGDIPEPGAKITVVVSPPGSPTEKPEEALLGGDQPSSTSQVPQVRRRPELTLRSIAC